MWQYNHTPDSDELYHGFGKKAHKYLMKIGEGAKARYLYTHKNNTKSRLNGVVKRRADASNTISGKVKEVGMEFNKRHGDQIRSTKKNIEKNIDQTKKEIEKTKKKIEKAKKKVDKYIKKTSKKIKKTSKKIKKNIQKDREKS